MWSVGLFLVPVPYYIFTITQLSLHLWFRWTVRRKAPLKSLLPLKSRDLFLPLSDIHNSEDLSANLHWTETSISHMKNPLLFSSLHYLCICLLTWIAKTVSLSVHGSLDIHFLSLFSPPRPPSLYMVHWTFAFSLSPRLQVVCWITTIISC